MLGYSLFKNLSQEKNLRVFGTVRSLKKIEKFYGEEEKRSLFLFDALGDEKNFTGLLQKIKPNYVLNCIGAISQKDIDTKIMTKLNTCLPHQISKACDLVETKLIHFSTDCVFTGSKGNYSELDIPDASDIYGKSKFLGEVSYNNHLTIRTSIIGHELLTNVNLIDWFLSQEETINGYSKAIFSGLPCYYIAEILTKYIFNNKVKGLFHLSTQPISKFDLLKKISQIYGKEIPIRKDVDYLSDKSLDSSKFSKLTGYKPLGWDELINNMYKDYCKFYNR
jgi:dTDP-4-dehydrorhamnose reductase